MIQPAKVAGFPTHVVRAGHGVRRVLFIHCTQGSSGTFAKVQAALLDKLSMVAFDRPGHGLSGAWSEQGDGRALHDLTTSIAARLIDKRADIVGHSFGATVALRLAMERPELVRRMILIEPPMIAALKGTPEWEVQAEAGAGLRRLVAAGELEAAARAFHANVNPERDWDSLSEPAQAALVGSVAMVTAEQGVSVDDSPGLLAPGRLEGIKAPTLFLEGTRSPEQLRAVTGVLAARVRGAQRAILAGAGHMSPVTHPQNVAGEIAAFLKL